MNHLAICFPTNSLKPSWPSFKRSFVHEPSLLVSCPMIPWMAICY